MPRLATSTIASAIVKSHPLFRVYNLRVLHLLFLSNHEPSARVGMIGCQVFLGISSSCPAPMSGQYSATLPTPRGFN
jgi:hypothetical protein